MLAVALCCGLAAAQNRPANWTSTHITLSKCGAFHQVFETVTEWRDEGRSVRELWFSRHSILDAYSDLTLSYDATGKLREVTWATAGDWDYGRLDWQLDAQGRVVSVLETGQRDGTPYARKPVPQQRPLPDVYRFRPKLAAYHRLGCTDTLWPTH